MIDVINYFKLVWLFSPWYLQALLVVALSFLALSVIMCIREFVIDHKSKKTDFEKSNGSKVRKGK